MLLRAHNMLITRRTYLGRAVGFARRHVLGAGQRLTDRVSPTYLASAPPGECLSYLEPIPAQLLQAHQTRLQALTVNYLAHRFDLLGSGWVQVRHGMRCSGMEGFRYEGGVAANADKEGRWLEGRINRSNLAESQRIWRLIDPELYPDRLAARFQVRLPLVRKHLVSRYSLRPQARRGYQGTVGTWRGCSICRSLAWAYVAGQKRGAWVHLSRTIRRRVSQRGTGLHCH